jgi:transposase
MEDELSSRTAKDWREGRRLRALELRQKGWPVTKIAEALGVTHGAVSQWMARARQGGAAALRHRPPPGPTPRLTAEQRAQIPALLARGPSAYGFSGEVWTTKRIAAVIAGTFAVRYHPAHVSRLVRALGHSVQKPITRATQRDEAAVEQWYGERWPALKKEGG